MTNSDFFGSGYLWIRNTYIIPLVGTSVDKKKTQYWLMKRVLLEGRKQYSYNTTDSFELVLSKEDYYKILIAEIMSFQSRASFQIKEVNEKHHSNNWHFVTMYYYFFYSCFTLVLLLHRGFVFLDKAIVEKINGYLSITDSVKITPGNYFFSESNVDEYNMLHVSFQKTKGNGVHEDLWNLLHKVISTEFFQHSTNEENTIMKRLNIVPQTYGSSFISTLRNYYNYNPEASSNDNNCKIGFVKCINEKFVQSFITSDSRKNDSNERKAIVAQYYAIILSSLKEKLFREYLFRSRKEGPIIDTLYLENT